MTRHLQSLRRLWHDNRDAAWRALSTLLFLSVLGLLLFRITNSLELGDEVYNASFVDDWLKGGINTSTFLVLHQTAGLLSYPFALVFHSVMGTEGLLLFFRLLFLCGNLIAAALLYKYLEKVTGRSTAFFAMLAMLAFIPSGAPTASYSSWGSQFLTVALSTLGLALITPAPRQARLWYLASAAAWSLMAISYPTLPAATFASLFLLWFSASNRRHARRYAWLVVTFLCLSAGLVVWVFTWDHLIASFEFLSAFNGSDNFAKKLNFTIAAFVNNPFFCGLLVLAFAIGILRRFVNDRVTATLTTCLLGSLLFLPVFPAAMLARSADAVMLATATGIGLLIDLRPGTQTEERRKILAVLYASSLCAACVTTVTATVSIWCFMIGALPGAIIAVASLGLSANARRHATAATAALAAVVLVTSVTLYSGEWPPVSERVRIDWGPAKGLAVPKWEASLINMMRDDINPMLEEGETILVEGRYSGLGVLSQARTKALSIYMLHVQYTTDRALERVAEFYENPANRPDLVVVYDDDTVRFYDPFGDNLLDWYEPLYEKPIAAGTVSVFRKKPASG